MTTDPTPHTERAAAAAAAHQKAKNALYEIANTCVDGFPMYESEVDKFAAIIAKHFNDDALVSALEAITRRVPIMGSTGDYREGQLHALEACREVAQAALAHRGESCKKNDPVFLTKDDALRLAAGRALEAISFLKEQLRHVEDLRRLGIGPTPSTLYDEAMTIGNEAITALSAALAGDKGKE